MSMRMRSLAPASVNKILLLHRIPFGDHPLKLERYREYEPGPCARMTRTNREVQTCFMLRACKRPLLHGPGSLPSDVVSAKLILPRVSLIICTHTICIYIYIYIYIHICIERERVIHVYIYIYICTSYPEECYFHRRRHSSYQLH